LRHELKTFVRIIMILALVFASLAAQDYMWPTNASHLLSATFGEYRKGHFHSGIDIKCNLKDGYPVFAIADGYIQRLYTSPFGYGKAVYLKLTDGNLAVYGHLDQFVPLLQKYVRAEQLREKRYATDQRFAPGQIPVQRGDTLGYTGSTGVRYAHLHFELRDSANQPVNPLLSNYRVTDYTIPVVKALAVVPLARSTRINASPQLQVFSAQYRGEKEYLLDDRVIQVQGPVGLEIRTYDRVHRLWNKYGPYQIELLVDGERQFYIQCDTLNFKQTHLIHIDRNRQLMVANQGRFIRLWRYSAAHQLPFHHGNHNGNLNLEPGYHTVAVRICDFNQNCAILNFQIYCGPDSRPVIQSVQPLDEQQYQVTLKRDSCYLYKRLQADWLNHYGHLTESLQLQDFTKTDSSYSFTVSRQDVRSAILRITAQPVYKAAELQSYYYLPVSLAGKPLDIKARFIHNPKTFLCELSCSQALPRNPQLFLQMPQKIQPVPLEQQNNLTCLTAPVPLSWWQQSNALEVRLQDTHELVFQKDLNFTLIDSVHQHYLSSPDSLAEVWLPARTVYDSLLMELRELPSQSLEKGIAISKTYQLFPTTQPWAANARLQIKYPPYLENIDQVGVYQWDQDEWKYIDALPLFGNGHFQAEIEEAGQYQLLRDKKPPVITAVFPGDGGRFNAQAVTMLKATVTDELSGIKDDTAILVLLDDQTLIAEYHPVQNYIRYRLPYRLKSGSHRLKITVTDRANNHTTHTSTFHIIQ